MLRSPVNAMDPHPAFRPARPEPDRLPWDDGPARDEDTLDLFGVPVEPAPTVEPAPSAPTTDARIRRREPIASRSRAHRSVQAQMREPFEAKSGTRAKRPASSRSAPVERPRRGRTVRTSVVQREREILALLRESGPLSHPEIAGRVHLGLVRCRCIVTNLCESGALTLTKKPSGSPSGGRPVHLFSVTVAADDDA